MEGIDTRVVCHFLAINPSVKPVAQRKQKIDEEKRISIDEKVSILASVGFIIEIKHLTWIGNVVMMKKATNKWNMCVDFTDLNTTNSKDLYA